MTVRFCQNLLRSKGFLTIAGFLLLSLLIAILVVLQNDSHPSSSSYYYFLQPLPDRYTREGDYVDTFTIYSATLLVDPTTIPNTQTQTNTNNNITLAMHLEYHRTVQNVPNNNNIDFIQQRMESKLTFATLNMTDVAFPELNLNFQCDFIDNNNNNNCGPLATLGDETEITIVDHTGRIMHTEGPDWNALQQLWTGDESYHHHNGSTSSSSSSSHVREHIVARHFLPHGPVQPTRVWQTVIELGGRKGTYRGETEFVEMLLQQDKTTMGIPCARLESVGTLRQMDYKLVSEGFFGSLFSSIQNVESAMSFSLFWDNQLKLMRKTVSHMSLRIDVENPLQTGGILQVPVDETVVTTTDFRMHHEEI